MDAARFFWALTLLSVTASAVPEPHYMVVVPAILYHPNVDKVCVLLSSLPESVHLSVTLEMKTQNYSIVEKDVEKPGISECINFQVPAFTPTEKTRDGEEEEVAHVHVRIRKGDSVSFEGRKKVLIRAVFILDIIETDKPFYKPGETVKFRILRLNDEFKALPDTIGSVVLMDPNRNRIGQWLNVETKQGIADLSFPLASEAALGMYSIQTGERETMMFFDVEEYELPKFEVLFELPPFVTFSDEEFLVRVCGKVRLWKPVHGKVDLTLRMTPSFRDYLSGEYNDIEKEHTGQTDKTGCASFTIHAADINMTQAGVGSSIGLFAELVDEETGAASRAQHDLTLSSKEVSIEFISLNPFYKQGFPYTGKMRASAGGIPAQNETVYLTVEVNDVETHFPYVTDENGDVHFSLDTTNWNNTLVSIRGRHSIENVTQGDIASTIRIYLEAFNWLKPFYSESNSFLEIQHVEEELPCGKEQEVLVDYIIDRKELGPEADHVDFYYLVVSRGRIVSRGQKEVPIGHDETLKGTFSLSLSASMDLAPTARLLVYAVFADGEVAADVDVFTIEKCFQHQVSVGFSKEEDVPGSEVNLQVEAAPGALCSLRALDKSVTLKAERSLNSESLYTSRYIDAGTVSGRGFAYRLEDFEPYPCLLHPGPSPRHKRSLAVAPWYQSEADVYSLFKLLRMKVFTNTRIKKPVSCERQPHERMLFRSDKAFTEPQPVAMADRGLQSLDSKAKKGKEKSKPRTYFPETWIWDLVPVNEEGKASHSVTAPDTITEWIADAFCVADVGFGIGKPVAIRIFQPFFVDVALPYSVVRGETFELKATVFNYLKDCIQVSVHLAELQQVEVKPCPTCSFAACLCSEEAETFSWNVTATQLGHVNLSVTTEAEETQELCGNRIAMTPPRGRSDTVIKPLLVKPEGDFKEETHNAFLCSSGDAVVEEVSLKLPENVVEDSGRAVFSVIGDILGPSLQHLDKLLEMPFGCGEQNMVKFVPNIFILQYLEATNQATPEIKAKAIEYMKKGYQRQLLYQHSNGSYSAFGQRDTEGNTWLTAFVARAFGQAKSYIFIDEKHIQDTVHWLEEHQQPDGCFENVGRLFNNALKGGVEDEFSLTAYVTAALLEVHLDQNSTTVEDALACLKRNLSFVEDAYPRALLAYVFTLAGDMETRQQLLRDLDEQADKEGGVVSWSDTETSAYVLLALLSKPEASADDIKEASLIAAALVKDQNSYGGFYSTQDTVVALQALSRYAALTYREIEGVQVLVKSTAGLHHEFHVDKGNRLVLQQVPLPEVPGQYKVEVSGSGCAYVQSTLRYNQPPEKCDAFTLSVETSPKECNRASRKYFDIHLQVSFTGQREKSNMALLEVNMLSGYIPVKKSVKALLEKPLVKKVEFEPDSVSIYLDELDSEEQCYVFSVEQEFDVKDLKPVTVKIYDYYHPDDYAVAEYNAPCSTESTKEDQGHSVPGD
ncbi:alpha-2-macroglobulin-like protein 1 [Heteronotia binoei]|uniref:alpha-2-macroglobulin-like protein 1 n=1 Tax=Heteronotia binoei TaxID=13085 RepID=UPI0029313476|nr:alpha-2-macroglobulin-like protein 1 [Heteronotia binoei]